MVLHHRAAQHQPGDQSAREARHVDQGKWVEQARARLKLACLDDAGRHNQPLVVAARHAFWRGFGARGPADAEHIVGGDGGVLFRLDQLGLVFSRQRIGPGRLNADHPGWQVGAPSQDRAHAWVGSAELAVHVGCQVGMAGPADLGESDGRLRCGERQNMCQLMFTVLHGYWRHDHAKPGTGQVHQVLLHAVGQVYHHDVIAT